MKNNNEKITLIVSRNGMGDGPDQLRKLLIKNYMTLLVEGEMQPAYICFYGEGVKQTIQGSEIVEELKILEKRGVNILICRTCLLYFGVLENVAAGTVATMLDIMGAQKNSDKVILL